MTRELAVGGNPREPEVLPVDVNFETDPIDGKEYLHVAYQQIVEASNLGLTIMIELGADFHHWSLTKVIHTLANLTDAPL